MIEKTIDLLKSYFTTNAVNPGELPGLIKKVHEALEGLRGTKDPAARWEDTVTDDYIVCLEDGRKMKILKRHLQQTYGMTPDEYRQKWNLPSDYPMVAKSYGARRSEIAKSQGLGKRD